MKLKVINSNSQGNAYILTASNGEALLIECGVNFDKIKQALNFNLRSVVGCLLTHEHGDHAKSIQQVMDHGINVYSSAGTHEALKTTNHHRAMKVKAGENVRLDGFVIKPFEVKHDVKEPFGYLINHPECGTVLFLTDSYYCEYKFEGLNNIIIEANYCQTIIDQRMRDGENSKFLRDRVITSHMSLATCKQTLQTYDLTNVMNIVLIHLSDGNSHEERFKNEVQESTGKLVHVAVPGLAIDFNKKPF